ncbi:MAG: hypothetical protein LBS16_05260 [Prevotellaceae bacterium]|jgi:ADP-heptose:LPS heptosyltransferase/tRNA A-37 threonylcarbamoyl transferase component Bud32|nr:hypothetical protein [Prevotellaceae bacterium]
MAVRILVIRFSAFGDVAMTLPVLDAIAHNYPQYHFYMLSDAKFASLFEHCPANVHFIGVDIQQDLHRLRDLIHLAKQLLPYRFNYVADLHNVLRTKILRLTLIGLNRHFAHINKGRFAKHRLTRRYRKVRQPLRPTIERYRQVFLALGFDCTYNYRGYFDGKAPDPSLFALVTPPKKKGEKWLGIAPFARYKGKVYPMEKMYCVVNYFATQQGFRIFLFGGDGNEKASLSQWASALPSTTVVAGMLSLKGELALMSQLDMMLSMDSANMHLASLVGVPVVSIWGATHPYGGFSGWQQPEEYAIQMDLPCRPCTVYGNWKCFRNDYACMETLPSEQIIDTVKRLLAAPVPSGTLWNLAQLPEDTSAGYGKTIVVAEEWRHCLKLCENINLIFDQQGSIIQQARNTTKRLAYNNIDLVIKSYKIPIGINRLIYGFLRKSKARRSFLYAKKLLQCGIGTPAPVAFVEERYFGFLYKSYYVTLMSVCRHQLREIILTESSSFDRSAIFDALAKLAATMHEHGILHKDFSMGNILFSLDNNAAVYLELVDLNRMFFGSIGMRLGCKNFERIMGTDAELSHIVRRYAELRHFDTQKCISLALRYRAQFFRKKRLSYSG